jgi:Protein of unknown function (DUF3365)
MKRSLVRLLAGCGLALGVVALSWSNAGGADKDKVDEAAVERTREKVKMLDDLYKGFVVNITEVYVRAQEKTPAARVAKRVFKHMSAQGWHTGRLIDTTGEPINRDNAPQAGFETEAVAKLKEGKTYYEEIARRDGKPVLRAATAVPVVMKACIACHPGTKEGQLLGALVYEVPIK